MKQEDRRREAGKMFIDIAKYIVTVVYLQTKGKHQGQILNIKFRA